MPELFDLCERVCEGIDGAPQADVVMAFGRLLDHAEQENTKLEASKPKPYAPLWDCRIDVHDARSALNFAEGCYRSHKLVQWFFEVEAIKDKPTLCRLWSLWDDVRATNTARKQPRKTMRQRVDVRTAFERAKAIYDQAFRRYYGLEARSENFYREYDLRKLSAPRGSRSQSKRNRKRGFRSSAPYIYKPE
jgi:hypothetical protein